jgi:hypothetical protein
MSFPMVVTDYFSANGWFADGSLVSQFQPGSMLIQQGSSTRGPCAARVVAARGECLEVIYTPPAVTAVGGWVGIFLLPRLQTTHPESTPVAAAGDPNWGQEPGLAVPAGARAISFYAATEMGTLSVSFRTGTENDPFLFLLPELTQVLTTTWTRHELPLAGARYDTGVLGAFAWVLHDTTRPATFFIDGIQWEGAPAVPEPPARIPEPPAAIRDGIRDGAP